MADFQNNRITSPFSFIKEMDLFTITMLASFVTWKFLNALYENVYEPSVDILVDGEETDKYYLKTGKYYVQVGMVVKEFIKWIILLIVLMVVYNYFKIKKN